MSKNDFKYSFMLSMLIYADFCFSNFLKDHRISRSLLPPCQGGQNKTAEKTGDRTHIVCNCDNEKEGGGE